MLSAFVQNWWAVALRGLFAVSFGVLTLIWPGVTLATLVLLFGAYSLTDGIFAIVAAARQRGRQWALLLEGLASIGVGLLALFWPGLTALAALYLIAARAVVTGVLELVAAVRLREVIERELLLALSGIASIALGVMMLLRPGAGALAVVWLIGAYALVFGGLLIGLGFRLRALKDPGYAGLVGTHAGA